MPRIKSIVALKKRSEFLATAAAKKRWVTPAFILQTASRPEDGKEPLCGFGLTASKKAVGGAVSRNRARRRLRALAHEVLPLVAGAGQNFVMIARGDILSRNYEELRRDLLWALKRLDVTRL
jgi:ribonuclease P protein component